MITVTVTDDDGVPLEDDDEATVTIIKMPIYLTHLPIILKPAPTILSVKNETRGKITYKVYHLTSGEEITQCTVESGHEVPCDHDGDDSHIFPPGTYRVEVFTDECGNGGGNVNFSSGPVTRRVKC